MYSKYLVEFVTTHSEFALRQGAIEICALSKLDAEGICRYIFHPNPIEILNIMETK